MLTPLCAQLCVREPVRVREGLGAECPRTGLSGDGGDAGALHAPLWGEESGRGASGDTITHCRPGGGALARCFRLGFVSGFWWPNPESSGVTCPCLLKRRCRWPRSSPNAQRGDGKRETQPAPPWPVGTRRGPPRPPGHSPPGGPSAPRGEGGDAGGGPCLRGGPGGGAGHRPWVSPSRVSRGQARADGGPRSSMGSVTRTPASQTQAPPGRPRPPARSRGESHRP